MSRQGHVTNSCEHPPAAQRGIALATALIFLVVITILGLVAVRSSTTELRLAHNAQVRVEALQAAQAVVDAVLANPANLPVSADPNYLRCYDAGAHGSQKDCPSESAGLVLPAQETVIAADAPAGECDPNASLFQSGVYAEAQRLPPEDVPVPGAFLTSMDKFHMAAFSVRGQYACGNTGLGSADIEQGVLKLVPNVERIN